eukprot:jgi/Ulvmu1/3597/UM017_0009.1
MVESLTADACTSTAAGGIDDVQNASVQTYTIMECTASQTGSTLMTVATQTDIRDVDASAGSTTDCSTQTVP